ncbi:hypothetical protein OG204_13580 [Streptomyces sp. NBC_01387]|uniref:hypothetical protein n=1 Tax=unclassified Streptomyces TaxID=2593676 RepID=UPI002E370642|nr:hypothetical protein [Streptomyces sp. NBC_01267]WSV56017.1 hypothetical protein OG282_21230 [Streptomyces sp. NBC_01014]
MNDSPGRASPGSAPSDGQDPGVPRPTEPSDQGDTAPKWSSNQPPPGRWTTPSPPDTASVPPQQTPRRGARASQSGNWGRPQSGSWGGPPQGGWGRQPDAPRPGVIPLRPLGVGEILDGAVSTLRAHWRAVFGLTVPVAAVVQGCSILVQHYLLPDPVQIDAGASPTEQLRQNIDALRTTLLDLGPVYAISLIGTIFTTAVLAIVVSRSVLGRPVALSEAWREARPQLPRLVGLSLLLPVLYAVVATVGILPGLLIGGTGGAALTVLGAFAVIAVMAWLWVWVGLAGPALMLERQSIADALRRSVKLVKGVWWRIFGIMLLTLVLTSVLSGIISLPFNAIAMAADGSSVTELVSGNSPAFGWPYLIVSGIGGVITAAVAYPFSAGVTVLLYIDQRIRREALDIDLARSAGVPGYDTSQS